MEGEGGAWNILSERSIQWYRGNGHILQGLAVLERRERRAAVRQTGPGLPGLNGASVLTGASRGL